MTTAGPGGLLSQASAVAAGTDVADAALRPAVAPTQVTVAGTDGLSVSLLCHGRLSTVAARGQTIIDMDADQYATGEGPCVDAATRGCRLHACTPSHSTTRPTGLRSPLKRASWA